MTSLDTASIAEPPRQNSHSVVIFDTTLRDGEQSPGASMTFEEKLQVADLLDAMGVDIIEAGFPVTSEGDFEAVTAIAERIEARERRGSCPRAGEADIDRCAEALRPARAATHPYVYLDLADPHEIQDAKAAGEVLEIVAARVAPGAQPRRRCRMVGEDATRTPIEYLCRCVEAAIKAGATTINMPDTVGYAVPHEYRAMFEHRARKSAGFRQGGLLRPLP